MYIQTILVVFKDITEGAHGRQPENFGVLVGWAGLVKNLDDILDNVACIASDDGLCCISAMFFSSLFFSSLPLPVVYQRKSAGTYTAL